MECMLLRFFLLLMPTDSYFTCFLFADTRSPRPRRSSRVSVASVSAIPPRLCFLVHVHSYAAARCHFLSFLIAQYVYRCIYCLSS